MEVQAADRIHRLGQWRPVSVTRFVVADSVEERIVKLQAKKQALFDSTVGRSVEASAKLTPEDLAFLFS